SSRINGHAVPEYLDYSAAGRTSAVPGISKAGNLEHARVRLIRPLLPLLIKQIIYLPAGQIHFYEIIIEGLHIIESTPCDSARVDVVAYPAWVRKGKVGGKGRPLGIGNQIAESG